MGSFRIPILSPGDGLESIFSSMPDPVKLFARDGFGLLSQFDARQLSQLAELITKGLHNSMQPDMDVLREELGISVRQASAVSMIVAIAVVVVTNGDSTQAALEAAESAGVLQAGGGSGFERLIDQLRTQELSLRESLKASELATETLPSFEDIQTTLDLRLGFEGSRVETSIPVVVAHLRTDVRDSHVWFQMQKGDVIRLISQFEKVLKQIEEAERWAKR